MQDASWGSQGSWLRRRHTPPPPTPSRLPGRIAYQHCDSAPTAHGWRPNNVGVAQHEGVPRFPGSEVRSGIREWGGRCGLLLATAVASASRGGHPNLTTRKHTV
jgi:hypothetical protein